MNVDEPALHRPLAGTGRRPGWRFLLAHPAHVVALGFGAGLSPLAPGTAGTFFAWIVWAALPASFGDDGRAALIGFALAFGCWACTVTARRLDAVDPAAIVWDEVVAFWIVLWLIAPAGLAVQAVAFVLFRIFDAAKPGPVAWADTLFKSRRGEPIGWRQGAGILLDDLVAALCTLVVIAVWQWF